MKRIVILLMVLVTLLISGDVLDTIDAKIKAIEKQKKELTEQYLRSMNQLIGAETILKQLKKELQDSTNELR